MAVITTPSPASMPIYRRIEQQLRARIESGELVPGDRLPSVNELRRDFGGVNHLTVRQALKQLSNDGLVRAEQGRGTFVQQRVRRVSRVALVLPHLEDTLFLSIARGVQRVLSEAGVKTIILDSRSDHTEESASFAHLQEMSLDAAIIFPVAGSEIVEHVYRLKADGFPLVLVDRTLKDFEMPAVVVDNYGGGYAIGTHLVKRGYKRVAWMSEMVSSAAQARLAGLRDGLAEDDIALPRTRQFELEVPLAPSGAHYRTVLNQTIDEHMKRLLTQDPMPDVIACGNDLTAMHVLQVLQDRGIAVPAQVAVTGFDDVAEAALCSPALTTARQPMERLGEEAAHLLLEILQGDGAVKREPLPVELVVRAST